MLVGAIDDVKRREVVNSRFLVTDEGARLRQEDTPRYTTRHYRDRDTGARVIVVDDGDARSAHLDPSLHEHVGADKGDIVLVRNAALRGGYDEVAPDGVGVRRWRDSELEARLTPS